MKFWACRVPILEPSWPARQAIALRNNTFPNPIGLVHFISKQAGTLKLRPDQKLVLIRPWDTPGARVKGLQAVLRQMAALAETPTN